MSTHGTVVVDTGVFGATLTPQRHAIKDIYATELAGRRLVISFQTVAELRYGAKRNSWGPKRIDQLERRIEIALTVPPHNALASEWADLREACRRSGHALVDKRHFGDLWIAATARIVNAPLVTHDRTFIGVPGLAVICRA